MKPVTEDFGVLFFQMKTTWGSWSLEPEGCILLLPLLRSQCNFFRRFLQKCRFSSVGTVIVCALQWELYLAVTDSALPPILGHTIQPATRQLSCSGAFLEEKKKKKGGGVGEGGGGSVCFFHPCLPCPPLDPSLSMGFSKALFCSILPLISPRVKSDQCQEPLVTSS